MPTSTPHVYAHAHAWAGVVILSSNAFVPYSGSTSLYVVGEVKNTSASNVRFVKINAVLRDNSGQDRGRRLFVCAGGGHQTRRPLAFPDHLLQCPDMGYCLAYRYVEYDH